MVGVRPNSQHIAVVGGGVIGLSIAWRAAAAGFAVTVLDPRPGSGASWVAGGMLAPVSEAWPGEDALLELGSASLRAWPAFAAELASAAGRNPGLRTEGTVVVAADRADQDDLERLANYLSHLDRAVDRLDARALRRLEPALGPAVRTGLAVPDDLAVDNRLLLTALRAACDRLAVRFLPRRVTSVSGGRVWSIPPDDRPADAVAEVEDFDAVVIAAGPWSPLVDERLRSVFPVKGEVLRLRARHGTLPPPTRTIRGRVRGRPVYLVPRDDGGLVVGATQYEAGFDDTVTAGSVRDLLRDAEVLLPALAEYELLECIAGLRPATPDNLPVIGVLEPGLLVATGHHRNGFLLTPITTEAVLDLLLDRPVTPAVRAADPARLDSPTGSASVGPDSEEPQR
ncbi:glycine oxidase [Actinoalloteichus hymeniacidonis]|uniref:glycine oxidase n=1 Tax=Actinoalloteichus hymeniacidonis TaxID=340345 RepID=A0AAC9HL85_9PSEU|nr:glycine oxidase [Actinoalloteichus hymeniacidonis]